MIITCPECATGYFVDDAQIRPGGRSVKCAACGARWTAHPERPLELVTDPEEGAVAREPPPAEEAPSPPVEDPAKIVRAKVTTKRQIRELAISGMVWGGMASLLAAGIGAALILRVDVVRLWPRTASAYAAIGLPVNRVGLVIEEIKAEPSLQDGHAALSISGKIRNVEDHAIVSPPLRITLFNASGKRVADQIRRPAHPNIAPGGALYFSSAILDPPMSARNMEVAFALDVTGKAPSTRPVRRAPAAPRDTSLRGAAVADSPPLAAAVTLEPAPAAGAPGPAAAPPGAAAAPDPGRHD